jgi:hypothetical protein
MQEQILCHAHLLIVINTQFEVSMCFLANAPSFVHYTSLTSSLLLSFSHLQVDRRIAAEVAAGEEEARLFDVLEMRAAAEAAQAQVTAVCVRGSLELCRD